MKQTEFEESASRVSELNVGDRSPEFVVEDVQRIDFVKYAGASGDFNPIHVVESYARDAGNPSVFGQGMLTAGFAASMLSSWLGLKHVRRFRTRFTSQVWPGDTLTAIGEITDKQEEDGATVLQVDLRVVNQDGEDVITGDAEARFPHG